MANSEITYIDELAVIKKRVKDINHIFAAQLLLSVRDFMRNKGDMKKPLEEMSVDEIISLTEPEMKP